MRAKMSHFESQKESFLKQQVVSAGMTAAISKIIVDNASENLVSTVIKALPTDFQSKIYHTYLVDPYKAIEVWYILTLELSGLTDECRTPEVGAAFVRYMDHWTGLNFASSVAAS